MITLRDAALLFDANERSILYWAKKNNITVTKVGDSWMVDDVAISKLFAHNIRWGNKYIEEEIRVREEALTNALLLIDDLIYLFKSVNHIAPIFRLIIHEMSQLIPDEEKKTIFLEVISGKSISEVAENLGISFTQASHLYESAISIIRKHKDFLSNHLTILADQETEINKLKIQNNNLKQHIKIIRTVIEQNRSKDTTEMTEDIPLPVVKLLSSNFAKDLKFDTRITNCMRSLYIDTVEDLLRYIKDNGGIQSIFEARNFGQKSFERLVLELEKLGIIDSDGNSDLLKYII